MTRHMTRKSSIGMIIYAIAFTYCPKNKDIFVQIPAKFRFAALLFMMLFGTFGIFVWDINAAE